MSTLTSTTESSPVKVTRVFADFRRGMPDAGTVFVGEERHRVQVSRTAGGLMARCECPNGCPARPDAIRAFQIMTEAWGRIPRARAGPDSVKENGLDPQGVPDQQRRGGRPYDGLARAICEADLQPMPIPPWAYDEHGIRRPLCEAQVAADVWYQIDRALDRLLGECSADHAGRNHGLDDQRPGADGRPNVLQYYRASWDPDLGLSQRAYEVDLPDEPGWQDEQAEGAA